jgi:hypothetical protein
MNEITFYIQMEVLWDVMYIKNEVWRFYNICNQNFKNLLSSMYY